MAKSIAFLICLVVTAAAAEEGPALSTNTSAHAADDRRVLEGIPRAGYDIYLNPFCGSLFSVLQYLRDPQEYDYLMGISGAAFRRLYNRDDGGNIDLMHYAPGPARHTFEALGYAHRTIPMDKGKMVAAIKESISRGTPVLAHGIIGPPEIGIVSGYEADGEVLYGYSYFQDPSIKGYYRKEKWWEKTKDNDPRGAIIIGDRAKPPSRLQILTSTLAFAVDLARKPAWPGIKDHSNGLAAYEDWAKGIEDDADFPPDKPDKLAWRLMIHGDQCVMLDERKHAAKFLRSMTKVAPSIAGDLNAAADLYDAAFGQMSSVWPWADGDMGPQRAKALAEHNTRVGIAAGVRRARKHEEKAVEHMARAVAKLRAMQDPVRTEETK